MTLQCCHSGLDPESGLFAKESIIRKKHASENLPSPLFAEEG
jgi:hypothetical protein